MESDTKQKHENNNADNGKGRKFDPPQLPHFSTDLNET